MRKTISVYSHEHDPAYACPVYFITRHEADMRIELGSVRYVNKRAVQLLPPPDWQPEIDRRGLFDKVWQPRMSAHYLVWQMRPEPDSEL